MLITGARARVCVWPSKTRVQRDKRDREAVYAMLPGVAITREQKDVVPARALLLLLLYTLYYNDGGGALHVLSPDPRIPGLPMTVPIRGAHGNYRENNRVRVRVPGRNYKRTKGCCTVGGVPPWGVVSTRRR